ncbi:MAG: PorV/PorQ family protein [Bacteroidota bacterium]
MKKTSKYILPVLAATMLGMPAFAGNEDRAGQAGATELLINPWIRNSGMGGANMASIKGLEAQFLNVAGTAFTKKTELVFARSLYIADIKINSFGFTQRVGATGVLGLGIMSMDFGDIPITTVNLPEGGIGTYSPQFINLGLSYAKAFSDNIYGGINIKAISEAISDVSARGVALDAGIQYVAGKFDNIHFGISLKNVGPRMRFNGDGLSFRGTVPSTGVTMTVEQRSADFELPSLVNIGGAYDFYFPNDSLAKKNHRLTIAGTFTSNSFSKDQFAVGLEYGFRSFLMVRAGYVYEKGIGSDEDRTTCFTGFNGGFTVEIPMNKEKGSTFGLDFSYRATQPFNGVIGIGARMNL